MSIKFDYSYALTSSLHMGGGFDVGATFDFYPIELFMNSF